MVIGFGPIGFGSNKSDRANSIAIDICDDIYITGEYQ